MARSAHRARSHPPGGERARQPGNHRRRPCFARNTGALHVQDMQTMQSMGRHRPGTGGWSVPERRTEPPPPGDRPGSASESDASSPAARSRPLAGPGPAGVLVGEGRAPPPGSHPTPPPMVATKRRRAARGKHGTHGNHETSPGPRGRPDQLAGTAPIPLRASTRGAGRTRPGVPETDPVRSAPRAAPSDGRRASRPIPGCVPGLRSAGRGHPNDFRPHPHDGEPTAADSSTSGPSAIVHARSRQKNGKKPSAPEPFHRIIKSVRRSR
jgi:hypothetical protein